MQIGQLVLRADGELLDHELKVVVARERHDLSFGVGRAHAERGGKRPAQGPGLAAIDPVAGLIDVQELRAGDLREADRRHIAGVAIEALVHLLIDALGFERDLIEMRPAQHVLLAMQALRRPLRPVLELAFRLQRASRLDEQLERRAGVGDDAEVRPEHAADLGRLDVDVNEFAALRVEVDRAGVAVGPAVADAEHEIRFEESRVAVAMAGLQSDHARHQVVIVGDRAPAHQGRDRRERR